MKTALASKPDAVKRVRGWRLSRFLGRYSQLMVNSKSKSRSTSSTSSKMVNS